MAMYDRKIEIRRKAQIRDEYNELTEELLLVAICYAQKVDNGGRKILDAGAVTYADDVEYTILYRKKVRVGQFISEGECRYEIVAVREVGRRKVLKLTCKLCNVH